MVKKEADIQKGIMDWLNAVGIMHWRVPVGPVIHRLGSGRNVRTIYKANPMKGFPDIAGLLTRKRPGVLFALEVKSEKGRLRPDQQVWLERIRWCGGVAEVVRSVEDVIELMRDVGEIK